MLIGAEQFVWFVIVNVVVLEPTKMPFTPPKTTWLLLTAASKSAAESVQGVVEVGVEVGVDKIETDVDPVLPWTVAVFVIRCPAVPDATCAAIARFAVELTFMSPIVQFPVTGAYVPTDAVAFTNVSPLGSTSVAITLVATAGPWFVTATLKWMVSPSCAVPTSAVFKTVRTDEVATGGVEVGAGVTSSIGTIETPVIAELCVQSDPTKLIVGLLGMDWPSVNIPTCAVIVSVTCDAAFSVPRSQIPVELEYVPTDGFAEMNVNRESSWSVTVTCVGSVSAGAPESVYVIVSPSCGAALLTESVIATAIEHCPFGWVHAFAIASGLMSAAVNKSIPTARERTFLFAIFMFANIFIFSTFEYEIVKSTKKFCCKRARWFINCPSFYHVW